MHSAATLASVAALVGTLVGCASPNPATAADPPSLPLLSFSPGSEVSESNVIDRWWLYFDDMDLHRRIADALEHNQDLHIASLRLKAARAQFDETVGAERPMVDANFFSGRSRVSEDTVGIRGAGAQVGSSLRLALTASHELDLWGRLGAATEAARQRLAAQTWARASAEWSLSAQVAETHFAQRSLLRQLEILAAVRLSRQRQLDVVQAAVRAGAASELDLNRSEAELAVAQSNEAALSRRMLAIESSLAMLTGVPLATLGGIVDERPSPLDPTRDISAHLPRGELSTLLVKRPDLRRAEAELAASSAELSQARAALLPSLRLSGSIGSDVRGLSNMFTGPGFAWMLASSLAQPLFDGGRREARVREQTALSGEASVRYQKAVAAAVLEVREAYLTLEHVTDAVASEHRRVEALGKAVRLARVGMQAGVLGQIDALDAERNYLQAQLAEVDAMRDRLLAHVLVFKALGGGHAAAASEPANR